jgi:hypothetical protein
MAHTNTWNAAAEAAPAATDPVSEGDDQIRKLRLDVRERIAKDHYMDIAGTDADHGEHQKITFQSQIAKPAAVANKGFLYIKDVSTKAMLFWEDEDGNEVQVTAGGCLNVFPSGTKMVFYQDTAPVGWTIQNTLDDKLLFITKGSAAGGQTGGGAHSAGTWTQPTHAHTINHVHTVTLPANYTLAYGPYPVPKAQNLTSGNASNTNSGAGSTANTWRPAAYCAIIAAKD